MHQYGHAEFSKNRIHYEYFKRQPRGARIKKKLLSGVTQGAVVVKTCVMYCNIWAAVRRNLILLYP